MKELNNGLVVGTIAELGTVTEKNGWKYLYFSVTHRRTWKQDGAEKEKKFVNQFKADNDLAIEVSGYAVGTRVLVQYHLESYEKTTDKGTFNNVSIIADTVTALGEVVDAQKQEKKTEDTPF